MFGLVRDQVLAAFFGAGNARSSSHSGFRTWCAICSPKAPWARRAGGVAAGLMVLATPIVQLRRLSHFRQRRPHLTSQAIRLGAAIGGSLAALAIMATILGVEAFGDGRDGTVTATEVARQVIRFSRF